MKTSQPFSLADILTLPLLREMASAPTYHRGEDYLHHGKVHSLRLLNGILSSKVHGSAFDDYDVCLWADGFVLDYSCSCPMGEDGEFCKHVVATGLAWLAGDDISGAARPQTQPANRKPGTRRPAPRSQRLPDDRELLLAYLQRQPNDVLAEWLLTECVNNADLHLALKTRALASRPKPASNTPGKKSPRARKDQRKH